MKTKLIILFAIITVALAAVCVVQWQKRDAQTAQLTSLRGEVEQKAREVADAQARQKHAETQKREILEQASDLAGKLQTQRLASAKAEAKVAQALAAAQSHSASQPKGGFGDALAKMMEDPEMVKVMREQQRMMIDSLYSPLVRKMNLTPQEADRLKDLLADNMMKGATQAMSLFGGSVATNRIEKAKVLSAEQQRFEQEVRSFLGDARFAEYQEYQQTVGERMKLNQHQIQNASSRSALTDQQIEQLLTWMKEEKQTVASPLGLPATQPGQDLSNLEAMLSDDGVQKLLQTQESVNQRVYDRAKAVLSEDQLAAFGKFQTNQLQMMRMGMNMARKFMGGAEASGATPANP